MSDVRRYRKKLVEVEAILFDGSGQSAAEVVEFLDLAFYDHGPDDIFIETLEGVVLAAPGDYIIKGVKGEFYPCKPDIFEATYEPLPLPRVGDLPPLGKEAK